MYDYISILAGGLCPFSCPYCVGHEWDQSGPPRFGEGVGRFLLTNPAHEISISGCTSDPMAVPDWREVLHNARLAQPEAVISLHTAHLGEVLKNITVLPHFIGELCLTVRSGMSPGKVAAVVEHISSTGTAVRLSSVCTAENRERYESGEFFNTYPAPRHTVRMNIFEPEQEMLLPQGKWIRDVHGQPVFGWKGQEIAIWDFREANEVISALYLWPDGQVREQCYWTNLHPDEE